MKIKVFTLLLIVFLITPISYANTLAENKHISFEILNDMLEIKRLNDVENAAGVELKINVENPEGLPLNIKAKITNLSTISDLNKLTIGSYDGRYGERIGKPKVRYQAKFSDDNQIGYIVTGFEHCGMEMNNIVCENAEEYQGDIGEFTDSLKPIPLQGINPIGSLGVSLKNLNNKFSGGETYDINLDTISFTKVELLKIGESSSIPYGQFECENECTLLEDNIESKPKNLVSGRSNGEFNYLIKIPIREDLTEGIYKGAITLTLSN